MKTSILMLAALSSLACIKFERADQQAQPSPDAIRIAALTDRTGTSATLSYSYAIELAFKQMNEGLGNSYQSTVEFALLKKDTASKTDQAVRQAREAVAAGARALITEISADTIAVNALNYSEDMGRPINCFACSSAFINDPMAKDNDPLRQMSERDERNFLHRLFMNSKYEAAVQMRVAMTRGPNRDGDTNGDGRFKVALIATDDPYGHGWESALRTKMTEMHPLGSSIEVMYVDPRVNDTSYNWSTDLTKLVDTRNEGTNEEDGKPDVIFLALLPVGSGAATKAYRESGYEIPLQATTAFRRLHILRSLGANAEGVEGGSPRAAAAESGMIFEAAFKAEFGEDSEMLSSGAYDCAVTHMLAALVAIGTSGDASKATPEAIRESLDRINDPAGVRVGVGPLEFAKAANAIKAGGTINYQGATGDTTFDANGDNNPVMVHYKVENKQFKELESYNCTIKNPLCEAVVP
jgi:ABC-type branched-subunit amino acid transport system substrate-binding protein